MTNTEPITNTQNIIDSRDIIARLEYLQGVATEAQQYAASTRQELASLLPGVEITDELADDVDNLWTAEDGTEYGSPKDWSEEDWEELQALKSLAVEGESATGAGWESGKALVHESYFTEYAEDSAESIYGFDSSIWPFTHINWELAADELKQDYHRLDFGGETFYVRS